MGGDDLLEAVEGEEVVGADFFVDRIGVEDAPAPAGDDEHGFVAREGDCPCEGAAELAEGPPDEEFRGETVEEFFHGAVCASVAASAASRSAAWASSMRRRSA